jgi:hypothetical protein
MVLGIFEKVEVDILILVLKVILDLIKGKMEKSDENKS